jgi:hypothetical protein
MLGAMGCVPRGTTPVLCTHPIILDNVILHLHFPCTRSLLLTCEQALAQRAVRNERHTVLTARLHDAAALRLPVQQAVLHLRTAVRCVMSMGYTFICRHTQPSSCVGTSIQLDSRKATLQLYCAYCSRKQQGQVAMLLAGK